jgi:hypothetical protein
MISFSSQEPSDLEKEYLTSRYWGSLFTDDHLPAREKETRKLKNMNTLWGFIIRKYADVSVPQLEYIAGTLLTLERTHN